MPFVSVTRLRIRSLRFLPMFALHMGATLRHVRRTPGFLGGALLADRGRAFWTMTVWRDGADMRRSMSVGAHLKAMPKLLHWCDQASVVHWSDAADTLPAWEVAEARMRSEGRPSRVRHPSPDHADLAFAPARLTGGVPVRPR